MKNGVSLKAKILTAIVAVALCYASVALWRAPKLWQCVLDEYNLNRDTHFSLLTGRCTVDTPKGRVYVDTLRGYDNTDNDHDHSN